MNLIFENDRFAVFNCSCGCDGQVKVRQDQRVYNNERFYIRHHAPLGCDPLRIGDRYDFEAAPEYDVLPQLETVHESHTCSQCGTEMHHSGSRTCVSCELTNESLALGLDWDENERKTDPLPAWSSDWNDDDDCS